MDSPVQTASFDHGIDKAAHPLDPLSALEITRATAIIQAHFPWGNDLRVETIDIEEPDKEVVRGHRAGHAVPPHRPVQHLPAWRDGRLAGPRRPRTRRGHLGTFQGRCAGHGRGGRGPADREDGEGRSALSGGAAPPRPVGRGRQHVHRPVDGRRIRLRGRTGPAGTQLLRLDAQFPARQLLRPSGRGAARADRPQHAGDPARR